MDTWAGQAANWTWNNVQDVARIGFGTFDVILGGSMIWTGAGTLPGIGLIALGLDQIATGSMNLRYGRVGQGFSIIEFGVYSATGDATLAFLAPGVFSLGFGSLGSFGRAGMRAGAMGGEAAVVGSGAGLTELRIGTGLLREGGWVDRWARFWKYDRTAETAMSEGRPILGGLWTLGKLDTLVLRDARYSIGWFDALAHEGVHILSGKLLWPLKSFIHNNQTGALLFGWVRFVEEFAAYNVGHLAVGRLHGLGPMAAHGAFRSISNRPIHVISTFVVFPFEVVGGVYIFRKYHSHR